MIRRGGFVPAPEPHAQVITMKGIIKILSMALLVCMVGLIAVPASAHPVVADTGDMTPDRETIPSWVLFGGDPEVESGSQGEVLNGDETTVSPDFRWQDIIDDLVHPYRGLLETRYA
jgi:hypothetical protein